MFGDILGKKSVNKKPDEYLLLKDEGFFKWFECPTCGMKFESDGSGMNCEVVVEIGPTGRGRRLRPICPCKQPSYDLYPPVEKKPLPKGQTLK